MAQGVEPRFGKQCGAGTMTTDPVLQTVTANRLTDGVPIYFTAADGWSTEIGDAALAADAAALLKRAETMTEEAVSPYVIAAEIVGGNVRPVGLREQIRAFGPTA